MFETFNDLLSKGKFGQANDVLDKIEFDSLSIEDKNRFAINKGMVLYELGSFQESNEWLTFEFDNTFIEKNKIFFYKGLVYKAMNMVRTSQLTRAITYLNSLLVEILPEKNDDLESIVLNWLGNAYWLKGNLKESLNYHEMALRIRRNTSNMTDIATSLNNIALIYRVQGKLKRSIGIYDEIISFGLPSLKGRSVILTNRSLAYFELGDLEKALDDQVKAFELRVSSGSQFLIADSIFNIIRTAYSLKNSSLLAEYNKKFDELEELPSVLSLKLMAQAYIKMIDNPSLTIDDWKFALNDSSLEFSYKLICYEEILSIYSLQYSYNFVQILEILSNFEHLAKKNNLYASLTKINFVRALLYKNLFEMDKAEHYFNEAIIISDNYGLPFHGDLAKLELQNLDIQMKKFNNLYENKQENILENDSKDILTYIQNFKSLLSDRFEN